MAKRYSMASKMASRTLYAFIFGTGLPSCVGVRILPRICSRGVSSREVLQKFGRAVVKLLDLPVGKHHLAHQFGQPGTRGLASGSAASWNMSKMRGLDGYAAAIQRVLRGHAGASSLSRKALDGIGLLPALDLFLGAVAGRIGGRVAADAVGDRVQQHRPAAFIERLLFAPEGVDHGQRVVAVDALGVHLLARYCR